VFQILLQDFPLRQALLFPQRFSSDVHSLYVLQEQNTQGVMNVLDIVTGTGMELVISGLNKRTVGRPKVDSLIIN